jgi:hypothetical protein
MPQGGVHPINLPAHKVHGVKQAIEAAGASLRYLPPTRMRQLSRRRRLRCNMSRKCSSARQRPASADPAFLEAPGASPKHRRELCGGATFGPPFLLKPWNNATPGAVWAVSALFCPPARARFSAPPPSPSLARGFFLSDRADSAVLFVRSYAASSARSGTTIRGSR